MYNSLVLAYIGDCVYELYVRNYLVKRGICKVNTLQKEAVKYVSAKPQSEFLNKLIESNMLNKEELDIVYKARNHKGTRHPKNTDIITYKHATAFEALIGYLYLNKNEDKLNEIIKFLIGD